MFYIGTSRAWKMTTMKRSTRQRLEYIEVMAYYTGAVSRSDVARAFGISDAAATKDLKLYGQLAPENLVYVHSLFGFAPTETFKALFADLSAENVLTLIASNLPASGWPLEQHPVYGVRTETLPLPRRLPENEVLAQIIRAIRNRKKLAIKYFSLSDSEKQERIIEPHAMVNTG